MGERTNRALKVIAIPILCVIGFFIAVWLLAWVSYGLTIGIIGLAEILKVVLPWPQLV